MVIIVIGSVYHGKFGWFYLLIIQLCFAAGDVGISALHSVALVNLFNIHTKGCVKFLVGLSFE
jgi:hypothetical protein